MVCIGGDAYISDTTSLSTTVTFRNAEAEEPGMCVNNEYELQLEATDCPGATGADTVSFTVTCCGVEAN